MKLRITEVFHSIQGESTFAGRRCAFIRLTGCDRRCRWCDTAYAFQGGEWRTVESLVTTVGGFGTDLACVTGGEPLAQPGVHALLAALCDAGLTVTLETGGHRDLALVDARVHKIMDLKPPGSGEVAGNRWGNLAHLGARDEIKFVLADRGDYLWARERVAEHELAARVGAVLMSPVHGELAPSDLAGWVLDDRLPVRVQLQLHALIWGPEARGV